MDSFLLDTPYSQSYYMKCKSLQIKQVIQSLRDSMKRPPSANLKKGNSYTIKFKIEI